jgi:hypothetical protein
MEFGVAEETGTPAPVDKIKPLGPADIMERLHEECTAALTSSVTGANVAALGRSYVFANDLDSWGDLLRGQPAATLVGAASAEYVLSVLNACQGQYRNAFKGLRLVLELCMQSVLLSADLVAQQEWLRGERHTNWAAIVNGDTGALSGRFAKAFFPELTPHVAHFRTLTETLYTELSECIHGNIPALIPLPDTLQFRQDTLDLWHSKAAIVRLTVHFAFALRHLKAATPEQAARVEGALMEQLGHIDAIRAEFAR